ncbi:MAG TPA: hypothetical protein PK158_01020 [Spirochaetota bacterium]|mgnify:CR=1 FL=1|nr:hypothetical protein [Spirochaetota bacterium]
MQLNVYPKAKRHPIVAFSIDGYFCGFLFNILKSYIKSNSHSGSNISLYIGISLLSLIIVYHAFLYKYLRVLTFGEMITGTIIHEQAKVNINPFRTNRFILWITILLWMLSLQKVTSGLFYLSNIKIVVLLAISLLFIVSFVLVNYGKIEGLFLYVFLGVIRAFSVRYLFLINDNYLEFKNIIEVVIMAAVFGTYFYIKSIKEKNCNGI